MRRENLALKATRLAWQVTSSQKCGKSIEHSHRPSSLTASESVLVSPQTRVKRDQSRLSVITGFQSRRQANKGRGSHERNHGLWFLLCLGKAAAPTQDPRQRTKDRRSEMFPETTRFWPSARLKPCPAAILGYWDNILSEDFQSEETGRKVCVLFSGIKFGEFFLTTVTFGCLGGGY